MKLQKKSCLLILVFLFLISISTGFEIFLSLHSLYAQTTNSNDWISVPVNFTNYISSDGYNFNYLGLAETEAIGNGNNVVFSFRKYGGLGAWHYYDYCAEYPMIGWSWMKDAQIPVDAAEIFIDFWVTIFPPPISNSEMQMGVHFGPLNFFLFVNPNHTDVWCYYTRQQQHEALPAGVIGSHRFRVWGDRIKKKITFKIDENDPFSLDFYDNLVSGGTWVGDKSSFACVFFSQISTPTGSFKGLGYYLPNGPSIASIETGNFSYVVSNVILKYKPNSVLKLTKVGIYYQHDIALSGHPGYPTTDTPVTIRAIVWAKDSPNGVEKPYTQEDWSAGSWNNLGVDGATVNFNPSSQSLPAIFGWPDTWPQIDFEWKVLIHKGTDPTSTIQDCSLPGHYGYDENGKKVVYCDKNRNYKYGHQSLLLWTSWGTDNIQLPEGNWRFRVKATINKGTAQEQVKESPDEENATRISVLDNSSSIVYGLNYLTWLTAYLGVPYEWGGYWFGGKVGDDVGGHVNYENYGIDCSGFVSCGACWAGYNWTSWRVTTTGLADAYYSSVINEKLLMSGDILNWKGHHVQTVYKIDTYAADGNPETITVIAAEGKPDNQVCFKGINWKNWKKKGYEARRLTPH